MKTCGQCKHYTGAGDWNLCCDIKHPTPKEREQGLDFCEGCGEFKSVVLEVKWDAESIDG